MKENIIFIILLILITDICDTVSQLLLKYSINSLDLHVNSIKKVLHLVAQLLKTPRVLIGFVFSVISLIMWLFVLTKADLNFAFSIDSMRYILIALASVLFLKEKIKFTRWMGIFAVICGIALVAIG